MGVKFISCNDNVPSTICGSLTAGILTATFTHTLLVLLRTGVTS